MSVREFNGTSDKLVTDIGGASGMAYGTAAFLVKFNTVTNFRAIGHFHNSGGSLTSLPLGLSNSSTWTTFSNGVSATYGAVSTGIWYLAVLRKASGVSTPRLSVYRYDLGTWTHTDASGTLDPFPTAGVGGNIQFSYQNGTSDFFGGRIAARAYWSNTLPWTAGSGGDASVESAGLQAAAYNWLSNNPTILQLFNQASTATPVSDSASGGTANQTSIVGTTVVNGDDPPGFDFSLSAGVTLTVQDILQAQSISNVVLNLGSPIKRVIFPTFREVLAARDPLLKRHKVDHPKSLVKIGGVWTEVITPSMQMLIDAGSGNFFLGGYEYIIPQSDAAAIGLPVQYLEDV